ncbi:hypothetical protein F7725_003814 [Dissostichus mawsoni]|uniref:Uncharacterized protein n=1 Tax=Dissostichus mawsoni TaxID=36200 RepID=A0A7J5YB79_DISMA|nr:hypothetical protein F7725_003814 [Dissostichus mawsoni]
MHMELHLDRRRELNSRCLSRAKVRKASRPSIRSQAIRPSGSEMGGSELAAVRRITKKTWGLERGEVSIQSTAMTKIMMMVMMMMMMWTLVVLTSVHSLEVLFSSLFLSSSSCSSSLMLSSRTLGQKSPSKYGSSLALVSRRERCAQPQLCPASSGTTPAAVWVWGSSGRRGDSGRYNRRLHWVSQQDLVVNICSDESRLEEVNAVQVGDVNSPLVGRRTVGAVLLDVHPEKTHVSSVDILECKQGFHPVGEGGAHLPAVHKPGAVKSELLPGLHPRLDLRHFVRHVDHADGDVSGLGEVLLPDVIVHSGLQIVPHTANHREGTKKQPPIRAGQDTQEEAEGKEGRRQEEAANRDAGFLSGRVF